MIFLNLALVAALAIEGVAAANSPTLTVPKVIVGRFMPMDWGFVQRSPLAHVMGPVSKRAALACPTGFTACNSSSSCAPDGSVCCDGGGSFCSAGTYCYTKNGVNGCCPTGETCAAPSGCQAGSIACPDNPNTCVVYGGTCCAGATSCLDGFSCCSDGCCANTSTDNNATSTTATDTGTTTPTTQAAEATGTGNAPSSSIPPITMGSSSIIAADLNSYVDWQGNWQTTTGSCASDARVATSNVSMSMKCSPDVAGYVMSLSVPKGASVKFNIDGEDYTYGWGNLKTPLGTYQNCNITYAYAFENTQDHVCTLDIGMASSTDQSSAMQVNAVVAFKNVADMQSYLNAAQSEDSSSSAWSSATSGSSATSTSAAKTSATSQASGAVLRAGINVRSAAVVACAAVLFVSAF